MRSALLLALLSSANMVIQFGHLWYTVTALGPGRETDALYAAVVVPQLLLAVVSGSLTHVLVPLLTSHEPAGRRSLAWTFAILVGATFSVGAVALAALAPWWVPLVVPGFSSSAQALTVTLTRIQLIGVVFTGVVSVLWSALHARQHFVRAEVALVMSNFAALCALVVGLPRYGVTAAAWATTLSATLQVVLLGPALGRFARPQWRTDEMREALRRIRPLLLGTIYFKTDPIVDRVLASMASPGGLSLLYFGQQIYAAANHVLNKAIASPVVPSLALAASRGDWQSFSLLYKKRLAVVTVCTGLGLLTFIVVGRQLIALLIGHGGVTAENVELLWTLMVAMGGVLIGGATGQITSVSFYAQGDTRTPTRLGVWTYTAYVPIKCLAFVAYGLVGLALATSAFALVNGALQYVILRRRVEARISANAGE